MGLLIRFWRDSIKTFQRGKNRLLERILTDDETWNISGIKRHKGCQKNRKMSILHVQKNLFANRSTEGRAHDFHSRRGGHFVLVCPVATATHSQYYKMIIHETLRPAIRQKSDRGTIRIWSSISSRHCASAHCQECDGTFGLIQ